MNFLETLHEWVGDTATYCRIVSGIQFTNSCWLWIRQRCHGYGYVKAKGQRWRVHRLMYEACKGSTNNLFVCHSCDVKNCVNPAHLFLGTGLDNMQDASQKKRWYKQHRTHCIRGHAFAEWGMTKRNGRECRKCHNDLRNERRRIYGR